MKAPRRVEGWQRQQFAMGQVDIKRLWDVWSWTEVLRRQALVRLQRALWSERLPASTVLCVWSTAELSSAKLGAARQLCLNILFRKRCCNISMKKQSGARTLVSVSRCCWIPLPDQKLLSRFSKAFPHYFVCAVTFNWHIFVYNNGAHTETTSRSLHGGNKHVNPCSTSQQCARERGAASLSEVTAHGEEGSKEEARFTLTKPPISTLNWPSWW